MKMVHGQKNKNLFMKKIILISLLFSAVISLSCVCGGGKPAVATTPQPTDTTNYTYMFIFTGESNSGGETPNTSATPAELAPRSNVQILNNSSFVFEDLDIGTNNTIDHFGITCCTKHGWELQLANRTDSLKSLYGDSVFLVKTGQGGSRLSQWSDKSGTSFSKFRQRVDTAEQYLSNRNVKKVIILSLGINDMIWDNGSITNDSFRVQMIRHINNLRSVTGGNTPVVMTKFFGEFTRMNNAIDSVAMAMDSVYTIDTTGAPTQDTAHWNYSGYKEIANRILAKIEDLFF